MQSIKLLLGATALALLAACGGDGGGAGGGATITGGVVKGPVLGSTVCAFALSGGAKGAAVPLALGAGAAGSISGGCYVTPADGTYNFALPAGTSGDLLIEATGGSFCSNESQVAAGACTGGGTVINLGSAVMSSIVAVPAAGSSATVFTTPLTTAAVTGGGAGMTSARFNTRFNTLAGQVLGAGTPVTPATPPTAANQPYLATAATALQSGGTLSSVVTALNNGTTTFPTTGGSGGATTMTATINSTHVGTKALKFYVRGGEGCGTYCSYTDGQDVNVVISGSGDINIGGLALNNPFVIDYGSGPNLHEISWYDAAHDIEYALSDNASGGTFSEINVYKGRQPASIFLGQIRMAEVPAATALAGIAGTYNNPQQYAGTANIAWSSVTITADGLVSFTGTGPTISAVQTVTVSSIGLTQYVHVMPVGGTVTGSIDNRIAFILTSPTTLKDIEYFNGNITVSGNKIGASVFTGTATAANITAPGTGTWAIPAVNGIQATVAGSLTTLDANMFFNGNTMGGFTLMADGPGNKLFVIAIDNPAGVMLNTNYSCVHGARTNRVQAHTSFSLQRNTQEGGNCNIVITNWTLSGTTITGIEGRFTAETYTYLRNDQALILDGGFRYNLPPAAP